MILLNKINYNKKLLGIVVLGLLLSGNAYAFCIFNCETKEKCRSYAKSTGGDKWQISDAYEYCMEREQNIKDYGKPLDDFIKQN